MAISYGTITITDLGSVTKVDVYYYVSTSATELSGGSWSTDAPAWSDNKYIWSKTVTTWEEGRTTESNPACITGAKGTTGQSGRSIQSIKEQYYLSTSSTSQVGGSWQDAMPTYVNGRYYWTHSIITWKEPNGSTTTETTTAVLAGALTSANSTAKSASDTATAANNTANAANTTANTANNTANAANTTAGEAKSIAQEAQSTAGQALTTANNKNKTFYQTSQPTGGSYLDGDSWYDTDDDNKLYIYNGTSKKWVAQQFGNAAIADSSITNAKIANATIQSAKIISLEGAKIVANSITANQLATDAIKSNNYQASPNTSSPYSATGTFLDLSTGNIYTPNFGVDSVNGAAHINGQIIATSGQIGDSSTNYWQIGTYNDYNMNPSAAIIGNGTSYIQSGTWQISNNRINTQTYDGNNQITYMHYGSKYWDYGMKVPELDSTKSTYINGVSNNWLYIRRSPSNSIPSLETDWEYLFRVDKDGTVYENGVKLSEKYASIDGVSGAYLPRSGGTITGNLTVNGTLTATASKANALTHTLTINGQSWSGSANLTINTLGVAYGGTGKTTGKDAANYFLNSLDTGSSTPVDGDYYISQYVGGGTTTTTYHRRPMSALWLYVKSKLSAADMYVSKTGGTFTGAVHVEDEFYADSATLGNLIVNGSGRFNNGIYGDLTGTATRATKVTDSGNNTDITFAYSKAGMTTTSWLAAWNGYELRAISPANVLTTIGAQPAGNYVSKSGDTMTGNLTVPTLKVDSIINQGDSNMYTHRIDFGRSSYNHMDFYEYGGIYNFYKNTNTNGNTNAVLLGKITSNGWEGNVVGNVTGNASTATTLQTARNITVGNKTNSFNGSANITYTLNDIGAIGRTSELLTTNPFAPVSLQGPYISKIDNAFYAADKRWTITATNVPNSPVSLLFDGSYDSQFQIRDGKTCVITFDFSNSTYFPDYPYGYILISFYYVAKPASVSGRVYCNYESHGIGWHDISFSPLSDNTSTSIVYRSEHQSYYSISQLEITIVGDTTNSYGYTGVTQIEMHLDRPSPSRNPFLSKYAAETLYYNLTAPNFIGNLTGNVTGNATSASKLNSTRSFTIGKTAKNVDWSGAVSFSQAEISDNASTSAAGWMSKDDKVKLNGIETGAQVNTITGVKGNSESSYRTGNVNITASNIGLGNVTNNKQIKGLSSGTTSGNLVTWGSDGYTVADSGIAKGSVTTKITLSGTDYTVSSNTITITKANLQSAIQDTSLVLMTSAERSKLSSIKVSEGGTIDFSGVTASAPITATVNQTTKAVNITHNTSGVTAGTYRSVTVNTYGHVTAGTNPTTLSGYGITDAKIASGVITLGSNTITPLTASSTLDATKLSGTASVSTTGNATTATKFSSNRSIALSGDTTGSASSNGESGWSITTKTSKMTTLADNRSVATTPNDYKNQIIFQGLKSNGYINSPSNTTYSYLIGLRGWSDNSGGNAHELAFNDNGIFRRNGATDTWGSWYKLIDSGNYNSYSPTLTGTGASGTWDIDISGNAATATSATSATSAASATKAINDGDGNTISSTYLKLSGGTVTGITQFNKTIRDANGQHYYGGAANRSQWYKITLAHNGVVPPTTDNQWYMCSMTIHMAGDYNICPRGTIELCYYIFWDKTKYNADKVYATGYGPNINKAKVYYNLTDPFVLYVDSSNPYTSIWVDYVSYRDSAQSHNSKETKVEITNAITVTDYTIVPTTYLYTTDGNYFYTSAHLRPISNNILNLGDSSYKWANIYATTFNGALNGNATSATSATSANSATKATQDSDGNQINTTYLKLAGGTMTGVLNAKANLYEDAFAGALNMNNSNIYGVNSIYTADASDNSQEGIHFFRDTTHVDSIHAKSGVLYFTPNRTLGQVGTSYTIYHTGNKPTKSDVGLGNVDNTADANKVVKGVSAIAGSADTYRHVWFSDSNPETSRNYDDDFKYNPSKNNLQVKNITGDSIQLTNWKVEEDSSTNSLMFRYVG